jgi:hypothetical protein
VDAPDTLAPEFRSNITSAIRKKWKRFEEKKPERRDLLVLISRMEVSATQARFLFQLNQDTESEHTDKDLTANPFLFYELTRYDEEPVSFATVDRGILPGKAIEDKFPLPESARMDGADDVWLGIRPMRNKWASCSTNGHLNFNEELLGFEPSVQDYVIVHELLHFFVPNHGRLWKSLMRAHLGDCERMEAKLTRGQGVLG